MFLETFDPRPGERAREVPTDESEAAVLDRSVSQDRREDGSRTFEEDLEEVLELAKPSPQDRGMPW